MMYSRRDLLGLVAATSSAAFVPGLVKGRGSVKTRLFLDVDTGRDDAWTILAAMENFEVTGVVASYGNTSLNKAMRNSLDVVLYAQKHGHHISHDEKHTPLYQGAAHPHSSAPEAAMIEIARREMVNGNGLCNVELFPSAQKPVSEAWQSVFLANLRDQEPVNYVVCGPLTNLADLIDAAENQGIELKNHILTVSIMGGSFDPALPVDFNFRADPDSALRVIRYFGQQIKLFPYDETRKLVVSVDMLDSLRPMSVTGRFNKKVMQAYSKGWSPDGNVLLHDPATLLAFEGGTVYTQEYINMAADGKIIRDPKGLEIKRFVIPAGQEEMVRNHILSRYLKLATAAVIRP